MQTATATPLRIRNTHMDMLKEGAYIPNSWRDKTPTNPLFSLFPSLSNSQYNRQEFFSYHPTYQTTLQWDLTIYTIPHQKTFIYINNITHKNTAVWADSSDALYTYIRHQHGSSGRLYFLELDGITIDTPPDTIIQRAYVALKAQQSDAHLLQFMAASATLRSIIQPDGSDIHLAIKPIQGDPISYNNTPYFPIYAHTNPYAHRDPSIHKTILGQVDPWSDEQYLTDQGMDRYGVHADHIPQFAACVGPWVHHVHLLSQITHPSAEDAVGCIGTSEISWLHDWVFMPPCWPGEDTILDTRQAHDSEHAWIQWMRTKADIDRTLRACVTPLPR